MSLKLATLAALLAGVSADGLGELLRCGHGHHGRPVTEVAAVAMDVMEGHHHHHHSEEELEEHRRHHHHDGHHHGHHHIDEEGRHHGHHHEHHHQGKHHHHDEEMPVEEVYIEEPLDIMFDAMPPVEAESSYGGAKMEQTFTKYKDIPVGEEQLKEAGWTKHNSKCDPTFGFVWTQDSSGATKSKPLKLYTTAAGQPSGVGIIIKGYGSDALPQQQQKYATANPLVGPAPEKELAHLDVAFRQGDVVCNGETSTEAIGDVLVLNPADKNGRFEMPLVDTQAEAEGWRRGSCFDGMGWHWFLDQAADKGQMSGKGENLFPVVTMYDQGKINAIFFASWSNQVSIPLLKYNEWEPVPLFEAAMCKNMCDEDCKFEGVSFWSTMHIYFRDHSEVTCPSELTCGLSIPSRGNCCELKSAVFV